MEKKGPRSLTKLCSRRVFVNILLRIENRWLSFCHHQFVGSFTYVFRTYLLSSCQTFGGTGGSVEPKTDKVPAVV